MDSFFIKFKKSIENYGIINIIQAKEVYFMEKRRKNSYRLECKWFQTKDDINIDKEDSWVGFISVFDDNSCIGCAIDARRSKPTHLLIGTMVEGKGLTLTKIHANNPDTIPQWYMGVFEKYKSEIMEDAVNTAKRELE